LEKIYGKTALSWISILFFGACVLMIFEKLAHGAKIPLQDWLVFISLIYLVFIAVARLIFPYLKYDKSGFSKWTSFGPKNYKWSDIKAIEYSKIMDQFFFSLSDRSKFVVGVNYTKDYRIALGALAPYLKKHCKNLVIPKNFLGNYAKKDKARRPKFIFCQTIIVELLGI
jgi:hypothetical protein